MSYSKNQNQFLTGEQGGKAFSIMIAICVLLSFIVQSILLCFTSAKSFTYIAVCSIVSPISILLALIYLIKFNNCTYKALNIKKFDKTTPILAVLLGFGMFCGLGFVNLALNGFLQDLGVNVSSPNLILDNIWQFIFFIVALAVLPAIMEELFFRGLFLTSLNGQSVLSKTLIVGLFFALYHCNLGQFVYQFIYGALLCLLTIYAKSVLPSVITHFLNNFVVILFTYLKIEINLFSPILIAVGLTCIATFLVVIVSKIKISKQEKIKHSVKEVFIPYGILGVVICLLELITVFLV